MLFPQPPADIPKTENSKYIFKWFNSFLIINFLFKVEAI